MCMKVLLMTDQRLLLLRRRHGVAFVSIRRLSFLWTHRGTVSTARGRHDHKVRDLCPDRHPKGGLTQYSITLSSSSSQIYLFSYLPTKKKYTSRSQGLNKDTLYLPQRRMHSNYRNANVSRLTQASMIRLPLYIATTPPKSLETKEKYNFVRGP